MIIQLTQGRFEIVDVYFQTVMEDSTKQMQIDHDARVNYMMAQAQDALHREMLQVDGAITYTSYDVAQLRTLYLHRLKVLRRLDK